jgi:hypothetical protein
MNSKVLKYHPIRYGHQMRPYFLDLVNRWLSAREGKHEGWDNIVGGLMMEHDFRELIQNNPRHAPQNVFDHAEWWSENMQLTARSYWYYRGRGENIFHFTPHLIELLDHTDVGDVTFDLLRFPFQTFYIHFEKPVAFKADLEIDGVYIQDLTFEHDLDDNAIDLTFTTRIPGKDYCQRLEIAEYLLGNACFSFLLEVNKRKTMAQAIEEMIRDTMNVPGVDKNGAQAWLCFSSKLVPLAINCLLYLSCEKRDIAQHYPVEAPERMVRATAEGTDKERERNRSKLFSLGFRKIHFCGASFHRRGEVKGGKVGPHWRRGHWRHQPHGPQASLRKLIWITPTVVRADLGQPIPKHLYALADPSHN